MSNHTPTTEEVREAYSTDVEGKDDWSSKMSRAEFDRWLAAHDAALLASVREWGVAATAYGLDSAASWGSDERGARHRAGKIGGYVLVERTYGDPVGPWAPVPTGSEDKQ